MQAGYKNIAFGPTHTHKTVRADGIIHFRLQQDLEAIPEKLTQKLVEWAEQEPDKTFLARRDKKGQWQKLSYAETLSQVKAIAQYLLNLNFSSDETIVILSENSLEHALLALAAIHIGIPYSPISPPYSLISQDFGKLKHCLELMTPKVIFAQNGGQYQKALELAKGLA